MTTRVPFLLVLLVACTASPTSTVDAPNAIIIGLPVAEIRIGDEIQITADVRNGLDAPLPGAAVEWSTDNPAIATVSATGRLRGIASGTALVRVRSGDVSASRTVIVRPIVALSLTIQPRPVTLRLGDRVKLAADVRGEGDYQLVNASVGWSVDFPDVATINVFGDLVAIAPGTVTVTAVSDAARGTLAVTVLPDLGASVFISGMTWPIKPGGTTQLTAKRVSDRGVLLPDGAMTWSSTDPAIATVSSTGLVTAVGVGRSTITVTTGGLSTSIPLSVVVADGPEHVIAFLRTFAPGQSHIEGVAEDGTTLFRLQPTIGFHTPLGAVVPTATLTPEGTIFFDCAGGFCRQDLARGTTTSSGFSNVSEPTWDDANGGLIFRRDYTSVVRIDRSNSSDVIPAAGQFVERPRISPDGRNILFECDYYQNFDDPYNLCHLDPAGSVTLYKSFGNAVSWSPRDGTLAYMRGLGFGTTARMLVIEPLQAQPNPDGAGAIEYPGFDNVTETVWSPDGQRMALVRDGQLWIYSLPGMTAPVRIAYVEGTKISSVSWR